MINIVFCLDKNIKESLKATITSILHHTKREINFYLICPKDDNLIFEEYIKSQSLPKINLGNFEPSEEILRIIANCSYCSGSRVANYSRFFIKSIFPKLEKMIYLDTDIIVLDDIGKMWDQGEFNSDIFLAAPKYIIYHKLFYIKKLSYYFSYLNENKYFFNGGVFMTDLKYWDNTFYKKLYHVTEDIMSNDISHVFTEILLNVMFPKFIPLNPAWNCSGYGTPHLYSIIKVRDYGFNPKILHWSGGCKPWSNKEIFKQKLWQYYLNDSANGIYLLYYDDYSNTSKYLLNSLNKISYNLIPKNVFKLNHNKEISKLECYKMMIEELGTDNYYLILDTYTNLVLNFDYNILDFMLENKIKILSNNSKKSLFGKGSDIIKLYFERIDNVVNNNTFFYKYNNNLNLETFVIECNNSDQQIYVSQNYKSKKSKQKNILSIINICFKNIMIILFSYLIYLFWQ